MLSLMHVKKIHQFLSGIKKMHNLAPLPKPRYRLVLHV